MLRTLVCTVAALLIFAVGLIAAEVKGKVKKVDTDKMTITVTVDDKDQDFTYNADTKVTRGDKATKDREKALKGIKEGSNISITTEKKDGKDVVTEIKLSGGKKQ